MCAKGAQGIFKTAEHFIVHKLKCLAPIAVPSKFLLID